MPEQNLETADRQHRVRRLAGLLVGGAVVASVAFAVPAMASQGSSTAQSAATITTASSTSSSSSTVLEAEAPVVSIEATTTTAAVETTTTTAPPSPEEQLRAKIATMTPEEAAAFKAYITPPPPTTTTTAPKPAPTTTAPKPAAPKAPQAQSSGPANSFLACVRQRESRGQYNINTGNGYYGAYQFSQSTWNNTANHAGRGDLVGRAPSSVSPADQDAMAAHLYGWQGRSPWAGPGC